MGRDGPAFCKNAGSERGSKLRVMEPLIRHFVTPSPTGEGNTTLASLQGLSL